LLKSALEKVVFFECRLDQLANELERANAEMGRLKADLSQASQRELALKQELAAAESRVSQARRERDEANAAVQAAHGERERLLAKLIEAERIRMAGQEVEGLDLAAFIADLRSEVVSLRSGKAMLADPAPQGFATTEDAAHAFESAGRLGITDADREELKAAARFETRSEQTLFALSLRELSSTDAVARMRAAQRLSALGARPALPAVAAALNAEQSTEVLCALLAVCGAANEPSVLPLVQARLSHASIEVRLAALEAASHLNDLRCLALALDDDAVRVRRRAAVLASNRTDSSAVLERAARDADASVRRVAALGLASLGGARAESALLVALDDNDPTVRRAAAKGLSRAFGAEVFAVADLDQARRRREIRRLSSLPQSAPSPSDVKDLEAEVLARVYAALRGQTEEDLMKSVPAAPERVREAAVALVGQGRLVRRGQRFFVP